MSALDKQVSGSHYKELVIQPIQFIHAKTFLLWKQMSSSIFADIKPRMD
jgi:hypothetical protein